MEDWNHPDQRIKDIEQGLESEVIETIEDPSTVQELYFNILKSVKKDMMIIFPSVNAFISQEKTGAIRLAQEAAEERDVKVRIMMPATNGHHLLKRLHIS